MIKSFLILLVFICASCAVSIKSINIPGHGSGYLIKCNMKMSQCHEKAREQCGPGYETIYSYRCYIRDGTRICRERATLIIKCR